jgi:hypothetical protein
VTIVLHMDPRLRPWRLHYWRFRARMRRARRNAAPYLPTRDELS